MEFLGFFLLHALTEKLQHEFVELFLALLFRRRVEVLDDVIAEPLTEGRTDFVFEDAGEAVVKSQVRDPSCNATLYMSVSTPHV